MLNNYKTNKQSTSSKICKKLVSDIKNYVNKDLFIQNIVRKINLSTKVPKKTLNQKIYQVVFNSFNFQKNKFEKFGLFFLVEDCLKYYFISLINILLHRKHIRKKLFFNLICDNVFNQNDFDRYLKLIKTFKNVCLLGSYYPENFKTKSNFRYKILNIGHSDQNLKSKFFFVKLGLLIFYYSILNRINYFRIFYLLKYDILKSNHIFSQISANYFFTNKFYATSPIFNHYFKKAGGIKASCYQKNILAYSLSCFVFSDILFTLGKSQGNICRQLGGEIKKILPVGSLTMENDWFNKKKDLKNVPFSNVIILGINTLLSHRHYVNHIYENSYYNLFLGWINKLSLDFPHLKIIHKHHSDYLNDPREVKKMMNSNVQTLVSDKSINRTYAYAHKSELILSFSSTMVLEILGNGKKAYFIDPNLSGEQWFDDIKKIKKFRIGNYPDLKKLVLNRNKLSQVNKLNKNFYCLNSNYTSERIAKYLMDKKKREN